jgi:hypothetical protein
MTDIKATLKNFEDAFSSIPTDAQFAIRDLIAEINEVGLDYTGGCTWRVTQSQFQLALDVLRIISPSITGELNEQGTFCVTWTANDFIVPDMNNLEEAFSPLAVGEAGPLCRSTSGDDFPSPQYDGGILCRSTSGDDWCVTPKSVRDDCPSSAYADDDCPSSYGMPNTRRHQPGPPIITGWDIDQAIRIEALAAAKSSGADWCVTPKSVPVGDDCPSSTYDEDQTPMFADDDCPSSYGGRR